MDAFFFILIFFFAFLTFISLSLLLFGKKESIKIIEFRELRIQFKDGLIIELNNPIQNINLKNIQIRIYIRIQVYLI